MSLSVASMPLTHLLVTPSPFRTIGFTSDIIESIALWLNLESETTDALITTLTMLLLFVLVRWITFRIISRRIKEVTAAYHWRRGVSILLTVMTAIGILRIWSDWFDNLGTFLGLVSAGLAIAFQDLLVNLAGWIFIISRRPFNVGDRIEFDGQKGDVIDIRLFQTFMLECGNWVDADQTTGRIIMIPNGKIFKSSTVSFTYGFQHIWDEIKVLITFESDWQKSKAILEEIARTVAQPMSEGAQEGIRKAASKHMIFFNKLTPIVYTDVKDSGIQFSIRFLSLPRQRRSSQNKIWEAILTEFAKHDDIDFAYPSIRYYQNQLEGKPDARMKLDEHGRPAT